jgi:hypothetical protein
MATHNTIGTDAHSTPMIGSITGSNNRVLFPMPTSGLVHLAGRSGKKLFFFFDTEGLRLFIPQLNGKSVPLRSRRFLTGRCKATAAL